MYNIHIEHNNNISLVRAAQCDCEMWYSVCICVCFHCHKFQDDKLTKECDLSSDFIMYVLRACWHHVHQPLARAILNAGFLANDPVIACLLFRQSNFILLRILFFFFAVAVVFLFFDT